MDLQINWRKHWQRAWITLGIWLGVSLLVSVFTLISVLSGAYYLSPLSIISFEFICILPWMFSTPLLVVAARNYRLDQRWTFSVVVIHLLVGFFVFSFHSIGQSAAVAWFFSESFMWEYVRFDFVRFLDMRIILYGGSILGIYTIDYYRRDQVNMVREPQLKAEINRVRYKAIKNQLQPIFLTNTIDAIVDIMRTDAERAETILADLSDLLRLMLQFTQKKEVTIREDLAFMRIYLRILEGRLNRSIDYTTRVDTNCLESRIPSSSTILPLLEQMLMYKQAEIKKLDKIVYEALYKEEGMVQLRLTLSGFELTEQALSICYKKAGIDKILGNIRQLYGQKYPFNLYSSSGKIFIELKLPRVVDEELRSWADRNQNEPGVSLENEMV